MVSQMIVYAVLSKHMAGNDEVVELDDIFFKQEDADARAVRIGKGTNSHNNSFWGEVEEREVK